LPEIFFDVSELFYSSKLKYYGIAKVVSETAYEISLVRPDVRFVIFSPAHRRFFEVSPLIGEESENKVFDPNIPEKAVPIWMRHTYHESHLARDAGILFAKPVIKAINLSRWRNAAGFVREVDLNGGVLIAMGRPKLMFDYIQDLRRERNSVRFFPLLHDLIPLHDFNAKKTYSMPRNFLHDNIGVIEFASGLLANSHFTCGDLQDFSRRGILPPLPPITAVPLVHEHRDIGDKPSVEPPSEPYLLCVGGLLGRKNLEAVFNAMRLRVEQGKPVPALVLAGAHRDSIAKALGRTDYRAIADKVVFIANPGQTDLARLYREALALVIPSRMEGWGLPAGEAFWHGTPVISSSAPALMEVCGDLGMYFDPDDPGNLAGHIDRLMHDQDYRAELVSKIKAARNTLRTWNNFARETLDAVERMLASERSEYNAPATINATRRSRSDKPESPADSSGSA
tara:strand:+ start:8613 stop:9974 length:1362 start_codon:yes stop_codon:yes gene_type:complete